MAAVMARPEVCWIALKEFTQGELTKHIFRETDPGKKSKNYEMNVFQTNMQGSSPCSLHSTLAAYAHAPHPEGLSGLEIWRKHFGRIQVSWVS